MPKHEMVERTEPKFFQFTGVGDSIDGVIMAFEKVEMEGRPVTRIVIMDEDTKELSCFLATYQIATKIRPSDKGHFVQVTYKGENRSIVKNGKALKEYDVRVSKNLIMAADDDIPF